MIHINIVVDNPAYRLPHETILKMYDYRGVGIPCKEHKLMIGTLLLLLLLLVLLRGFASAASIHKPVYDVLI
jgi:hypothetical protein